MCSLHTCAGVHPKGCEAAGYRACRDEVVTKRGFKPSYMVTDQDAAVAAQIAKGGWLSCILLLTRCVCSGMVMVGPGIPGWTTSLSHFPDTGHDGVDETVPGMEDTKHAYDRAHRMAKVKGELHKYANNYQLPEE